MAKSLKEEFTKGIIKENPVLRLMLGTCATLAVTTAASNAIGMGLATTFVLVCSNAVISLLKKIIPDKVRIPAYITIVAGFVTIVQLLIKAYVPALNKSLGVFLPLIVVNCIILGRAEMFASKNPVLPSIVDGLGMGVGFTAALLAMGIIRELLGAGTVFGIPLLSNFMDPIIIFLLPPGVPCPQAQKAQHVHSVDLVEFPAGLHEGVVGGVNVIRQRQDSGVCAGSVAAVVGKSDSTSVVWACTAISASAMSCISRSTG